MKKKRNGGIGNKKVPLTKSLAGLMKDEDGFVSKGAILKIGLSTVAVLGATGVLTETTHTNLVHAQCTTTHTNVVTHSSY